jgi:DNA topoisomerase-2
VTQKEHILLRPDTYIGSVEVEDQDMWIMDDNGKIVKRMISYV